MVHKRKKKSSSDSESLSVLRGIHKMEMALNAKDKELDREWNAYDKSMTGSDKQWAEWEKAFDESDRQFEEEERRIEKEEEKMRRAEERIDMDRLIDEGKADVVYQPYPKDESDFMSLPTRPEDIPEESQDDYYKRQTEEYEKFINSQKANAEKLAKSATKIYETVKEIPLEVKYKIAQLKETLKKKPPVAKKKAVKVTDIKKGEILFPTKKEMEHAEAHELKSAHKEISEVLKEIEEEEAKHPK
jgi:hypothetical protein